MDRVKTREELYQIERIFLEQSDEETEKGFAYSLSRKRFRLVEAALCQSVYKVGGLAGQN